MPSSVTGVVDGDDVRRGRCAAASFDSRRNRARKRLVVDVVGAEQLQRDLAVQPGMGGEVDDAHAAPTDHRLDVIRPEVGADAGVGTLRRHGAMKRRACKKKS